MGRELRTQERKNSRTQEAEKQENRETGGGISGEQKIREKMRVEENQDCRGRIAVDGGIETG
jgi:hypothetical protein